MKGIAVSKKSRGSRNNWGSQIAEGQTLIRDAFAVQVQAGRSPTTIRRSASIRTMLSPYNNRGDACNGKGNCDRAIADLDQAIALKSDSPNPDSHRGYAYGRKGDFDRAMAPNAEYTPSTMPPFADIAYFTIR